MWSPTGVVTIREHTILASTLSQRSTIVDLGASTGDFSQTIVQRFHCRCIAVEPNPTLFERLRAIAGVEGVWSAVSESEGETELNLADDPAASTILSNHASVKTNGLRVKVPTTTLENLFSRLNVTHVDLLKVDIEGAEIGMLLSTPDSVLRSIDQISVEFHDFCGLNTSAEVSAVLSRLDAAGFEPIRFDRWGNTDWLFGQRATSAFTPLRRAYLQQFARVRWLKIKLNRRARILLLGRTRALMRA
jgi:FkbM family methyltransferase